MVTELKSKCFKEALTKAPVHRNPIEQWGFEKTTFFALMYLQENNFLTGSNMYNALSKFKPNLKTLIQSVKNSTDILSKYKILKSESDKLKRVEKNKARKNIKDTSQPTWIQTPAVKQVRSTNQAKLSKMVSTRNLVKHAKIIGGK